MLLGVKNKTFEATIPSFEGKMIAKSNYNDLCYDGIRGIWKNTSLIFIILIKFLMYLEVFSSTFYHKNKRFCYIY